VGGVNSFVKTLSKLPIFGSFFYFRLGFSVPLNASFK
jgi:hypothetical protein